MNTSILRLSDGINSIVPTRNLNLMYIIIDSIFIVVFLALLVYKKRYATTIFALFGGILYFIVDYCGFYLMSHTRVITINNEIASNGMTAAILFWMSMSYGITNFAFIWVLVAKDKYSKIWIFLIVIWWLIAPSIAELGGEKIICTSRTTGAYHGFMGIALIVGYLGLIIYTLVKEQKAGTILWLCAIGFAVQFGWEFSLLINGIRPMNESSIITLLVNSCLETNLGMPYIYAIYLIYSKYFNEDLTKVKIEKLDQINSEN